MGGLRKRGQITVFIILGIVILMTSALYFYYQKEIIQDKTPEDIDKKTTELTPYVKACMEINAREALSIIGRTGGYITYPDGINSDPSSYLKVSPVLSSRMPYWWYAGQEIIPPLTREENQGFSIQKEIEDYILQNIDTCLDNFTSIKAYEVSKNGKPDVQVLFGERDVSITMKYPIKAVKIPERNEFEMNGYDFFVRVPIRFKKVYTTAKKIMEDENTNYFMERFTIDLMTLADYPDNPYAVPIMNMNFKLSPYKWTTKKVQDNIKTLLEANTQYIKFKGTEYVPMDDNYQNTDYPVSYDYMKNHYIWGFDLDENIKRGDYKGIHASVTYNSNWPLRMEVSPLRGGVMKSGSTGIGKYLSFIGIQTWHFTYNIVYPNMITITDEPGKNNEDYSFSYAFLVSIKNNRAYKENFASTIFDLNDQTTEEEQCEYMTEMQTNMITFSTTNEYNLKPVKRANLSLTCGRYTCSLGQTNIDGDTNHGLLSTLTTTAPYCVNGILRAVKEGYDDAEMIVTTNGAKTNFDILMKPVVEYTNYTVLQRYYQPDAAQWRQFGPVKDIIENQDTRAVITLEDEFGKQQTVMYPPEENFTQAIKLFKDKKTQYNVTIYLFNEKTDDLIGGYQGAIDIDNEYEVNENNFITFYAIDYADKKDEEKMGLFMMGLADYSKKIQSPELSKQEITN